MSKSLSRVTGALCAMLLLFQWSCHAPEEKAPDKSEIRLPSASNATKPAVNRSRIHVDIPDPDFYAAQTGRPLNTSGIPILVEGRQATSLDDLREMLKEHADPAKYPDKQTINLDGTTDVPVSSRTVHIRCDREQDFGWIGIVLCACTMFPGDDPKIILKTSPLIFRVELAVEEGRVFVTDLPVSQDLSSEEPHVFAVTLGVSREQRGNPAVSREVGLRVNGGRNVIARFTGLTPNASGGVDLKADPEGLEMNLSKRIADADRAKKLDSIKLNCDARVPFAYAAKVIDLTRSDRMMSITYNGIPQVVINDLIESWRK